MRRLAQAVLVAAAGVASNPVAAAPVPLFGTAEFRVDSLAELPQWQRVLRRAEAEEGAVRACVEHAERCPNRATRAWASLLRDVAHLSSRTQVEAVHRFVSERKYRADADNYGLSDYWATPLEFFRRSGDCEDYVIAKYRSLRLLGMPADRLRMVVVQDVVRDLPHAVLAVYIEDVALILDNLSAPVLTQDRVGHYVPYYSVNERARWIHTPADPPSPPPCSRTSSRPGPDASCRVPVDKRRSGAFRPATRRPVPPARDRRRDGQSARPGARGAAPRGRSP